MPSITKRGNSFLIRVSMGYDQNGKQMLRSMTWKPEPGMSPAAARKEAERQAILFEDRVKGGPLPSSITLGELIDKWFTEYSELKHKRTTIYRNRQMAEKIKNSRLAGMKVMNITYGDVQHYINSLSREKKLTNGKPLARKTVKKHLSLISSVFTFAKKRGLVKVNPCQDIDLPRCTAEERRVYTPEEAGRLFRLLKNAPIKYRTFIMLAIFTGLRRGELMGLEWSRVDLENGILVVDKTSSYTPDDGNYTDIPKTKNSKRVVRLDKHIIQLLKELKASQEAERRALGTKWVASDRLFIQDTGAPMDLNTPYNWMKRFCKRNDIRFCNVHSLRHFYASALIDQGLDVIAVSRSLGHGSTTTTLDIYGHDFDLAAAKSSEAISSGLGYLWQDETPVKRAKVRVYKKPRTRRQGVKKI